MKELKDALTGIEKAIEMMASVKGDTSALEAEKYRVQECIRYIAAAEKAAAEKAAAKAAAEKAAAKAIAASKAARVKVDPRAQFEAALEEMENPSPNKKVPETVQNEVKRLVKTGVKKNDAWKKAWEKFHVEKRMNREVQKAYRWAKSSPKRWRSIINNRHRLGLYTQASLDKFVMNLFKNDGTTNIGSVVEEKQTYNPFA